ncbi:MAG TPA: type II toxin-antitoxin system VapC family toxin [Acidobacteriaceae bacterium]|jgi:ribonuclease VapC|nr:type II toxin-antitoxin system VapC family toxin [Acidobacteriaceae bacterium]
MILDTSVFIAIIKEEPEAAGFAGLLEATDELRISAATYLESSIVLDRMKNPKLSARLSEILERAQVIVEPFTAEQAQIARQAYRDYGRGSGHKANLNFGDCFSYALARVKREPLLYKGDDFVHTDIRSV